MEKLTDVYTYDPCCTLPKYQGSHLFGAQIWYKNDSIHREGDLPAVIAEDGSAVYYCIDGVCHRDTDLPAVEQFGTFKAWYVHGELHRVGGPAKIVFQPCGGVEYFYHQHGLLHRDERDSEGALLPANFTEMPSGVHLYEQFFLEGRCVNKDGTPDVSCYPSFRSAP